RPDPRDEPRTRPVPDAARRRTAVLESRLALVAEALEPLVDRRAAHSGRVGRRRHLPAQLPHPLDHQPADDRRRPSVTMRLHPGTSSAYAVLASHKPTYREARGVYKALGLHT